MAFFTNDAVNRINVHSAIRVLAQGAGGIFTLAFLLKAGLSIPIVMLAAAAIAAGRFAIRPLLLPCAFLVGVKTMLLFGTVALAAQYLVLPRVHGLGVPLAVLCAVTSLAEVVYWMFINTTFSMLGDAEFRGHQVSAGEAIRALSGIAGPILGAWAITRLGAGKAFALVALIQVASVIPLLRLPAIPVQRRVAGAFKASLAGILFSAADGWLDAYFLILWQVALFVSLGESFANYGGAMALAALVGAVCGVFIGRHVDAGHGRRAVLLAYAVLLTVALLRSAALASPALAVIGNASGSIAMILISPVIGVISNRAKASPCPLRFHMGTEAGWDAAYFAACVLAAALLSAGVPMAMVILLAISGGFAGSVILWRLYPAGAESIKSEASLEVAGGGDV